jgi:hypothetical protein
MGRLCCCVVGHPSTTFLRNLDSAPNSDFEKVHECVIQAQGAQRRNRLESIFWRANVGSMIGLKKRTGTEDYERVENGANREWDETPDRELCRSHFSEFSKAV